jgi:hypothetical protein
MVDEGFQRLQTNLHFREADLAANRAGALSRRQRAALRCNAIVWATPFIAIPVIQTARGWRSEPSAAGKVGMIAFAMLFVAAAVAVLVQGFRPSRVERIDAWSFAICPPRFKSNRPGIDVDGQMYEVLPGRLHRTTTLLEGRSWTFYAIVSGRWTPRPRIVSAEPLLG